MLTNAPLHIHSEIPKIEPWNWKASFEEIYSRHELALWWRGFARLFLWNYWRYSFFSALNIVKLLYQQCDICNKLLTMAVVAFKVNIFVLLSWTKCLSKIFHLPSADCAYRKKKHVDSGGMVDRDSNAPGVESHILTDTLTPQNILYSRKFK